MTELTAQQAEFIDRFILSLPDAGPTSDAAGDTAPLKALARELRGIWDAQKSRADGQIERLQAVLREQNSPACREAADKGLNGWTDGLQVALARTFIECERASAKTAAGALKEAKTVFRDYESFLHTHPAVETMRQNPFQITVDLTGTLGQALKDMQAAVDAAEF